MNNSFVAIDSEKDINKKRQLVNNLLNSVKQNANNSISKLNEINKNICDAKKIDTTINSIPDKLRYFKERIENISENVGRGIVIENTGILGKNIAETGNENYAKIENDIDIMKNIVNTYIDDKRKIANGLHDTCVKYRTKYIEIRSKYFYLSPNNSFPTIPDVL